MLLCFGLNAYAVDVVVDGDIRTRSEYDNTLFVLQDVHRESYCNLEGAYLHWKADPANNAVYLAVQYESSDMSKEPDVSREEMAQAVQKTGVELTVNGRRCGTIRMDQQSLKTADAGFLANGYSTDMDQNRFMLAECKWFLVTGVTANTQCEMCVGLKYWEGESLDIGVRIFDYSGNASNYRTVCVYEKPEETTTTTTQPQEETEKATKEKTTKEKTTKETTTTTATATVTTTAAESKQTHAAQTQTSREKKTELPHERVALTGLSRAATSAVQSSLTEKEKEKEKKEKKTTKKLTAVPQKAESTETIVSDPMLSEQTETETARTESAETIREADSTFETAYALPTRLSGIQSRGKVIGVAAAASLLTGAVMFSVFAIGRSSAPKRDETDVREDENKNTPGSSA